jgi:hypothetical protein
VKNGLRNIQAAAYNSACTRVHCTVRELLNHKSGVVGGGVRKWQFLIAFSTESNHKGEGSLKFRRPGYEMYFFFQLKKQMKKQINKK